VRRLDAEQHSLAAILDLIRNGEPQTRQDLERLSGLGRAIVADRLATLVRSGLAATGGLGQASGGRAPRLMHFRSDAGLILVAVIDAGMIGVGLADLSGKLLFEHHEATDQPGGPATALRRLAPLFDWVLEQQGGRRQVWGIGVALPGPAALSPLAGWHGRIELASVDRSVGPLLDQLARRYRAPLSIHSSVQMRTLGEWRAGNGAGARSLLFVDLGREIAAGLLSDGRLLHGAQGAAGMMGHIPVAAANQTICRCGNRGCLDVVAAAGALVEEATRAAGEGRSRLLVETLSANGELSVNDIGLAAQRGDAFSAELLSRSGGQIGTVLAALTNAFNPAVIVLGGEIAETGDILLAAIREAVYRRAHPLVTRDLRIIQSQLGNSAGLVGSALTLADEFFAAGFLREWIAFGSPLGHPRIAAHLAELAAEAVDVSAASTGAAAE
jgi:predicted NBD/HSP70 family sugar kinase